MNDGAALLRAIIDHPDEDIPRLMYADWLDEQGDAPRAEFIRVQIDLSRRDQFGGWECKVCGARPQPDGNLELGEVEHGKGCYVLHEDGGGSEYIETEPEYKALRDRAYALSANRCPEWFPNPTKQEWKWCLPEERWDRCGCWFARGFVERVKLSAADWLTHADSLLAAHPIREVELTTRFDWYVHHFRRVCLQAVGMDNVYECRRAKDGCWCGKEPPVRSRIIEEEWPALKFKTLPGSYLDDLTTTAPI